MDTKVIENTTRNDITELYRKNGSKIGVEVGVCTGKFSETICRHNPQAKVIGVDDYDVLEYRTARDRTKEEQDQFPAVFPSLCLLLVVSQFLVVLSLVLYSCSNLSL